MESDVVEFLTWIAIAIILFGVGLSSLSLARAVAPTESVRAANLQSDADEEERRGGERDPATSDARDDGALKPRSEAGALDRRLGGDGERADDGV